MSRQEVRKGEELPEKNLKEFLHQHHLINSPQSELLVKQGIKICRQANGYWREDFDKRKSPFGKEYYWLSGEFVNKDKGEDTDIWALENGYVSIVPVQFDLTAHHMIQKLNSWDL